MTRVVSFMGKSNMLRPPICSCHSTRITLCCPGSTATTVPLTTA